MLRNRILISGTKQLQLTLGSYSYSATPAAGSTTVYAYYGGVAITDLTSSMVSKSGNMSSVSVNSSGVITMRYNSNTSTTSTKTSTMTLTYQGQTKTFTITQAKDYVKNTSTSHANYITGDDKKTYPTISLTDNGDGTSTAVSDFSFTYRVEDIATTTTYYASGTSTSSRTVASSVTKTCAIPKKYLKFDQTKTGEYILINTGFTDTTDDFTIHVFSINSKPCIEAYSSTDEVYDVYHAYDVRIMSNSWVTNPSSVKIYVNQFNFTD